MLGVSNIWAGGQNRPCKDSSPAHLYYTKVSDRKTIKRQKFLEMFVFFGVLVSLLKRSNV